MSAQSLRSLKRLPLATFGTPIAALSRLLLDWAHRLPRRIVPLHLPDGLVGIIGRPADGLEG